METESTNRGTTSATVPDGNEAEGEGWDRCVHVST